MYGEDYRYAASRLCNTIVRLGVKPVFIEAIESCNHVMYFDMTDNDHKICKLSELNVKPIPLGWSNYNLSAIYSARAAMRKDWRQGLRSENIRIVDSRGDMCRVDITRVVMSLTQPYPKFSKVLDMMKKANFRSAAWCREWAVDKQGNLLWKFGSIVGELVNGKPILDQSHHFLKESLEESLV